MFFSQNVGGNLHEAVSYVNKLGVSHLVHSFHGIGGGSSIVIFEFKDYAAYVYFCEKMHLEYVRLDQFDKGILYKPFIKEST